MENSIVRSFAMKRKFILNWSIINKTTNHLSTRII